MWTGPHDRHSDGPNHVQSVRDIFPINEDYLPIGKSANGTAATDAAAIAKVWASSAVPCSYQANWVTLQASRASCSPGIATGQGQRSPRGLPPTDAMVAITD